MKYLLRGFESNPAEAALCAHLTRILLPGQLFFLAGGVFAAVLLVRKQFAVQAVTPLVYNCGIIFGGVLLYRFLGPSALAVGAVAGAFLGPFLLNAIWAHRAGMRYRDLVPDRQGGRIIASHIHIRDAGPGIADAELAKVLQPFYRLEQSRNRNSGGVGLGLATAADIAQRLGGSLRLRNVVDGGLCATVELPLIKG